MRSGHFRHVLARSAALEFEGSIAETSSRWIRANEQLTWESIIAKNRNTYAKRQREQEKKQRADDKRLKRERKKDRDEPAQPAQPVQVE